MHRWFGPSARLALSVLLTAVASGCGLLDDPPTGGASSSSTPSSPAGPSTTAPDTAVVTTMVSPEPKAEVEPGPASEGALLLRADLVGAAAVPGPGDADGSARLIVTPDGEDEVCFSLMPVNVGAISGLHLHEGKTGAEGPVVIDLTTPDTDSTRGCPHVDLAALARIAARPGDFYADIHTGDPPAIAVRGQLD